MIHFIGAGPGDPELITVKGLKLLQRADVIIYAGSLVNREILKYKKDTARVYDSKDMTLDEVIDVFIDSEKKGLDTVRLHTGDPSLYGAIKEQIDLLIENDIEFDITPGVSSMSAAAALLKTEYTLPGVSQTVEISRIEGKTKAPKGKTKILFLSSNLLLKAREELLSEGFKDDTPAAIVYKASHKDEAYYLTSVKDLYKTGKENGINKTALIIVGDILKGEYEKSRLYDKSFSTMYRKGNKSEGDTL